MMPGLVVKHTNNNVAILEYLSSTPEQGIINNKLNTMEENHENNTTEKQIENRVPENNNSTDLDEISVEYPKEKLDIQTNDHQENCTEKLLDKMDVPKYPDKQPPERNDNETGQAAAAADKNSSHNIIEHNNSISLNSGESSSVSSSPSSSTLSKINIKKQHKLKTFLNKYNVTETELMLKLKHIKRLTKEKTKLDSVLSHKLNRNYLKILKRRRSIKNKINHTNIQTEHADDSDEYSTCESDDSGTVLAAATTLNQEENTQIINNQDIRFVSTEIHTEQADVSEEEEIDPLDNKDNINEIEFVDIIENHSEKIDEINNEPIEDVLQETDDVMQKTLNDIINISKEFLDSKVNIDANLPVAEEDLPNSVNDINKMSEDFIHLLDSIEEDIQDIDVQINEENPEEESHNSENESEENASVTQSEDEKEHLFEIVEVEEDNFFQEQKIESIDLTTEETDHLQENEGTPELTILENEDPEQKIENTDLTSAESLENEDVPELKTLDIEDPQQKIESIDLTSKETDDLVENEEPLKVKILENEDPEQKTEIIKLTSEETDDLLENEEPSEIKILEIEDPEQKIENNDLTSVETDDLQKNEDLSELKIVENEDPEQKIENNDLTSKENDDLSDLIIVETEDSEKEIKNKGLTSEEKEDLSDLIIDETEDLEQKIENNDLISEENEDVSDLIIDETEDPEQTIENNDLTSEENKDLSDLIIDETEDPEQKIENNDLNTEENEDLSDLIIDETEDPEQTIENNDLTSEENEDLSDLIIVESEDPEQKIENSECTAAESDDLLENEDMPLKIFEIEDLEEKIENVEETTAVQENDENTNLNNKKEKDNKEDSKALNIVTNLYEDDDIRNKIKLQLELLRRNTRKQPTIEIEPSESPERDTNPAETEETTNVNQEEEVCPKVNLSDVLLSNEGELAIVNVVGGYVSENDSVDEVEEEIKNDTEDTIATKTEDAKQPQQIKRGISITDKLLMNFSQENSHIIKPTKTTDITKIKGWRSKTFNVLNEEDAAPLSESLEDVNVEQEIPPLIYYKNATQDGSLDNPLPGTSFGMIVQQPEIITEPPTTPMNDALKLPEEGNKKSAFVSDYLESYLSTNTELKISYEVPKLVAEEGITKPGSEMPISNDFQQAQPVNENNTTTSYKSKGSANKKAKPKTLAEKRRMLELDRKNELMHNMEVNEQMYLKRLEYCEKRNKTEIAKDIRENLVAANVPFSRLCWRLATKENRQFAVCNGKKIRISGSLGGRDIIIPKTNINQFNSSKLSDINRVGNSSSSYRPGPLSKKHKLLNHLNWECQVLKMPKIKLEVYPEQCKPLPLIAQQYLQLCRHDQYIVNKNWAKFAVTAVKSNEKPEKPNKFEFEIPYANGRNKILVRKPVKKLSPIKYPERTYSNRFPEINVDENIKDIVSDLLTSVENRELDSKIIKDDPDLDGLFDKTEKDVDRPPSPIDRRVQAIIKRPNAKRNKTTLELRRLNVQVIEVDVKEDESIPENCTKDYCKLGCVCKSLRGASALIPEHCGREQCMLKCTCSFDTLQKGRHQITLPAGTDLLSASTVVRLQDEAKRNLAKEEREFTQTVIKANNQTIMVGGGARERTRRVPKVPKKYTNFAVDKPNPKGVSSYDKMISEGTIEEEMIDIEHMEFKTTPKKKQPDTDESMYVEAKKLVPIWINKDKEKIEKRSNQIETKCRVVLKKMKLDNVIPWCMVHNLYKCHCGGKACFPQQTQPAKPIQNPVEDTDYIAYNPRFGVRHHTDTIPHTVTDVTDKYCARTKALPTNYYHARNKSQRFKAGYAVLKEKEDKNTSINSVGQSNVLIRNKRKSLDGHETYANDELSFDSQDLLVPIKKKSTYVKKRQESQSILLPQTKRNAQISSVEDDENDALIKRRKSIQEDDDPLESLSLLERLRDPSYHPKMISTVKTFRKVSVDKISKMTKKPRKHKLKGIMRNPDKIPSMKISSPPMPDNLQLTSEDFVSNIDSKLISEDDQIKRRLENTHIVSSTAFIDYDRSYMGLLIPSKEWLGKFHKMLNPNDHTIIHQIRLLEWATMVKRQAINSLQVWCNTKKYNNIILTEDRRRPSKSHINVKTFRNYPLQNFKIPDIISSLLSDRLPGAAVKATETYLILVFNGTNWEARGTIVLSGTTEICKQKLALRPTPPHILSPNTVWSNFFQANAPNTANKQLSLESVNGTLIIKSTPSMSVEVRNNKEIMSPAAPHKTNLPLPPSAPLAPPPLPPPPSSSSSSALEIISLPPLSPNKPDYENNIPTIDRTKYNIGNILAPLPTGGDLHRWFMLILENDFSVLRISFSKFHIKYTHLQTAINMARKSQKTVRIKTPLTNSPEVSENFSIYACPESTQRIFFGPYGNRTDHGLETFRYVNGKLVNTKIYNKMRGNPERKTAGYWFTHNSTLNNNLNLEPNYDEGSSGSECATAVTSIENVCKPEIELVDLTGHDSESETEFPMPKTKGGSPEADPLLNLLSVDFSKKVADDITIEAIPTNAQEMQHQVCRTEISQDMEIRPINTPVPSAKKDVVRNKKDRKNIRKDAKKDTIKKEVVNQDEDALKKIDRKRKSIPEITEEPVAKQPTLIDSIELDDEDDEEMPVLEPYNKEQNIIKSPNTQMPPLCPINAMVSKDRDKTKNKCLYVITNIPGIGYFEIFFEKNKLNRQSMYTSIKGSKTTFQTINNAIKYLHYLCTKCIYFMPKTLKVKFSIVDSAEPPDMPKFKDEFLNGYHMISERGIFNILNINTKDLDHLGFDEEEIQKLLSHKCDLLIARNIKQLGTFLFGYDTAKKMTQEDILHLAPSKIKLMEEEETELIEEKTKMNAHQQNLLVSLDDLQRDVPESLRNMTKQKISNILGDKKKCSAEQEYSNNWNVSSHVFPLNNNTPSERSSNPDTSSKPQSLSLLSSTKLDTPATVKPIVVPNQPSAQLLGNSAVINNKTISPIIPVGKFCRIVDGQIILLDNNSSTIKPVASTTISNTTQKPTSSSVNILSTQQFQNLINPNPNDKNSKFELLVPITGLQSPATVVGFGQNVQNTTIIPAAAIHSQPKIVDLTDD